MQIPCPNCEHPLNFGGEIPAAETSQVFETIAGVSCPNCGFVPLNNGPFSSESAEDASNRTISYASTAEDHAKRQISHFRLSRLLGHGGFGSVWLADDINLGRQVALKLPHSRKKEVANLLHEAQAAAHLRHPHIVSIYEVGTEDGQVFIASEYIEGMTLRDLLTTGKPTTARAVELSILIAGALQHAHSNQIVHRDIKPANILLNMQGQPFVTDFGLAKRVAAQSTESTISSQGQIMGTARYMSPEQASGKTRETDYRSDIYALGVILFEMLTGHVPFRGNIRALLQQKMFEDPPSPRTLDPTVPRDLETICLKCLERDPGKRYASAGELARELERFRNGEPILARPVSPLERTWRWCRRRPLVAGLLLSLFTSLSIGLAGVTFYSIRATRNAQLLRESLYRAQMTLAADYVAHGDFQSLRQTLDVAYDEDGPDLRGFEWYYYNALAEPFAQIVHHGDHVADVAISGDGSLVASVGNDRRVRVWSRNDGELISTLSEDAGAVNCAAFSPLNDRLVTGSADGRIRVWNPRDATEPLQVEKHGPAVSFVAFSPDGRRVVSAGVKGPVRVRDAESLRMSAEIPTGQSENKAVQFSPDGSSLFVATADGRVRMSDVQSSELQQVFGPNESLESIAVSDDGRILVVGTYGGELRFWTTTDGRLIHKQQTDLGLIGDMAYLKADKYLALASVATELVLYDTEEHRIVRRTPTHFLTRGLLDRSGDGRFLVIGSGDGSVKILRTSAIEQPNLVAHQSQIRGLMFLDSQHVIAASGDGALRVWNVANCRPKTLVEPGGPVVTKASGHASTGQIAIAATDAPVRIYATEEGRVTRNIPVRGGGVIDLQFSPAGDRLAIVERDGGVQLVDVVDTTIAPIRLPSSDETVTAVAFSSDGSRLIFGCQSGAICVADAKRGASITVLDRIQGTPRAIVECPQSRVAAVGTDSGHIHLVDQAAVQATRVIRAHTSRINVLCVMPDGFSLVSGGRDRELRLWDTKSAEMLTALPGHTRQVFALAVAPDGQTLASGDLHGDIRLWRAPR